MAIPAVDYQLVNFPATARIASVFAAITRGSVALSIQTGGKSFGAKSQPLSPMYHLNNPASAVHLQVQLEGGPSVLAVTAVNDSKDQAEVMLAVGLSVLPRENQEKLKKSVTVESGATAFFHYVLNPVPLGEE
jgi:hypothetical protein